METCTRNQLINILSESQLDQVFMYVSALSNYVQVDKANVIMKIADSGIAYFEYEISPARKFIFIDVNK